jgi:hypothetical protein
VKRRRGAGAVLLAAGLMVLPSLGQAQVRRIDPPQESGVIQCVQPEVTYVPELPQRVEGAPFSFAVTWDPTINSHPGWQTVIQQAINEWQSVLTDDGCSANPLPLYVRARSMGGQLLALTNAYSSGVNGCIVFDTLSVNTDFTWFVDPTPWDDSEFTSGAPPAGYDLLTVIRHELGHAVGWTLTSKNSSLMADSTFAPQRLNLLTTTTRGVGWHVNPDWLPNDLMVPSIGQSVRRPIRPYPDVAGPARGFDGAMTMGFIDPGNAGAELGTPSFPWRTIPLAFGSAPAGWTLMLAGTTHHVAQYSLFNVNRTIDAVRGGASVVAP